MIYQCENVFAPYQILTEEENICHDNDLNKSLGIFNKILETRIKSQSVKFHMYQETLHS